MELVGAIEKVAREKACTPAQLAIGWVRAQSKTKGFPTIVPIPGATTVNRVSENMKEIRITDEELADIEKILDTIPVEGARYPDHLDIFALLKGFRSILFKVQIRSNRSPYNLHLNSP
jgi:pyridoxine 4-dehydrogenase